MSFENVRHFAFCAALCGSLFGGACLPESLCVDHDIACSPNAALLMLVAPGGGQTDASSRLAVSVSGLHACVLLESGVVRCWGDPNGGRLGYGNTIRIGDDESPSTAGDVGIGAAAVRIFAGGARTCAVLESGALRCFGAANLGRLGYGNLEDIGDDELPSAAGDVNVGGAVEQIAMGTNHTCALLVSGAVRCWGASPNGELGYANSVTIGDDEAPITAGDVNVGGAVRQIAAGDNHTCALLEAGNVRCWGRGAAGRLGYANTANIGDDETPATAGDVNVGGAVRQIAADADHTCAVLESGAVRCWGNGGAGQLGYASTLVIGDDETPASAGDVNVGGAVRQIAAGGEHSCALLEAGTVRCWGAAVFGQPGYGNTVAIGDDETPASAGDVDVGGAVRQIAAGGSQNCALLESGALRCWGNGSAGQLGYGNTEIIGDDESPAAAGDVSYE